MVTSAFQAALDCWRRAVALRPTHAAAWGNSMALLDSKGMSSAAVELGQEALQHVPASAAVHFALGNVMGKLNRYANNRVKSVGFCATIAETLRPVFWRKTCGSNVQGVPNWVAKLKQCVLYRKMSQPSFRGIFANFKTKF